MGESGRDIIAPPPNPIAKMITTRRRTIAVRWLVGLAIVATSCKNDSTVPLTLTTVSVTLTSPSIQAGATTTATATGAAQNGNSFTPVVTWSTASPAVATISATGTITGVSAGTTQVIATSGGVTAQAPITVTNPPPVLTTINVSLPLSTIWMRQTVTATAGGLDQYNAAISVGAVTWSSTTPAVATVDASTGLITGVSLGTTQVTATFGAKSAARTVTVSAPPALVVNEVESSGGTPGDWIEIYNPTNAAVDISGWGFRDNDALHVIARVPTGTTIPAGGYYIAEEAMLGFGLGAGDDARLYTPFDVLVDAYTWTAHATTTYGRCPNGTGAFVTMTTVTKGTANDCTTGGGGTGGGTGTAAAWFGLDDVTTVDGLSIFGGNLSGLMYEAASGGNPAVLWGARNGPGSIFRLIFNGTIWTPDAANGWSAGKGLKYPDGTGEPDTEDITFTTGSAAGIYTIAERNNSANSVSRNSILRFDPSGSSTSLTATNEWNLTADLPVTGANLGIEAVTWIPDAFLVSKGFVDESTGLAYNPSRYANHGTGLFFVGVEANGIIYAYALDHSTNGFTRVATFSSGFPAGVMALSYDRDFNYLWAECDDGCGGLIATFEINVATGKFQQTRQFNRPASMPNINNEGFAVEPTAACVSGKKFVYWADDSETGGHAIRRATVSCTALP